MVLKIETVFKKMLLIIKEALIDHIGNEGNIPKVGRNPKFSDVKVIILKRNWFSGFTLKPSPYFRRGLR